MCAKQSKKLDKALLVGQCVYIRAPRQHDCDEFIALNQISRHFHKGWSYPPIKPTQYAEYMKRCRRSDFAGFFVCRVIEGDIIGSINLSQICRGSFQSAYLGYQIGAPYASQGYMTEAIQLVLQYAFLKLKLHRIEANIQPTNLASLALVKRAGFTLEGYSRRYLKIGGRWRDHERWAILVEEWQAKKRPRR
ncbi:MAG: GNAT family protein [Acidobacteriota bacterium]